MFTIFLTGDLHTNIDRPFNYLKGKKNPDTIILDTGDVLGGCNLFPVGYYECFKLMKEAGYDAMTLGNRELNYHRHVLLKRLDIAGFSIVSSNIIDLKGQLNGALPAYNKIYAGNNEIFILGLTPPQYPEGHFWEKLSGLRFYEPKKAIAGILKTLPKNIPVILLSHLGLLHDIELAEIFPEIQLILGGHSHTLTFAPIEVNNANIIHIGFNGKFVGRINFDIIDGFKFKLKDFELINI